MLWQLVARRLPLLLYSGVLTPKSVLAFELRVRQSKIAVLTRAVRGVQISFN